MTTSTLVDLVKVSITSTGAGSLSLGSAVPGFRGTEALIDNTTYSYSIQQNGNYEVGQGVFTLVDQSFTRFPTASSSSGQPIAVQAGAELTFTALAADLIPSNPSGGGGPVAGQQFIAQIGFIETPGASEIFQGIHFPYAVLLTSNLVADSGRLIGIPPTAPYVITLRQYVVGDVTGTIVGSITINTDRTIQRATLGSAPLLCPQFSVLEFVGAVTPQGATRFYEDLIGTYQG